MLTSHTDFKKQSLGKINSFTADNGSEFSKHEELKKTIRITTYFAKPHSPWERPTNENSNGLIREFFPKRHDFSKETQASINHAIDLINGRPRKCLKWHTAKEVFTAGK